MSFTAWAHSHARSILFLLAALAIAGAVASLSMPVALFPQVSFPRVRITLDAGDRPAEQMTVEVTTPVEGSGARHSRRAQLEIDNQPRHGRNLGQFQLG